MSESVLIEKIFMDCPVCDKKHFVEKRRRTANVTVHNKSVTYEEQYYFCENAPEYECEFATGGVENENIARAKEAYVKL